MSSKPILQVIAMDCSPEKEEKFNKWYTESHVPLILKCGGVKEAARYKRIGENEEFPKYLALYEYESKEAMDAERNAPEFAAVGEDVRKAWPNGLPPPKWVVQYELIKKWKK
jgi:uncharacterized protein (TIGR02118 family)